MQYFTIQHEFKHTTALVEKYVEESKRKLGESANENLNFIAKSIIYYGLYRNKICNNSNFLESVSIFKIY